MNISKVIGVVKEGRGTDGARIEVISFKKNGEIITNLTEIKKNFPSNGFVFSPHFFKDLPYELGSLIEFFIIPASKKIEKGDEFILDIYRDCKHAGFQVFEIEDAILINELSINQPLLKNFINEESTHFYIKHKGFLYGAFKNFNGNIIPVYYDALTLLAIANIFLILVKPYLLF